MREMKDSGIEWIGKIPKEWGIVKFKYLHNGLNTGEAIDKEYWESDAGPNAFYTAGLTPIRTGYSNFPTWKETGENDLLLARNGTPYVYLPVSKAYYTDHIIRAAMSRHVNRRFIRYCLQQSIASIVVDSVSIPTWSATLWNNQILTWPSAIEQERIAAFLDAECAEIDTVLEKTRASIEEYKKLKQAVITQAVTKGIRGDRPMKDSGIEWIGDIPAEWTASKIKYCTEFAPSCNTSHLSEDSLVTFTPMECIKNGYFENREAHFSALSSSYTQYQDGDIVFAKVTPCFENGNIAIMQGLSAGVGFGSSELFVIRPQSINTEFIFYYLQNDIFKQYACATMTGTGGLKRVSPTFVRNYSVFIPCNEEQLEIVRYLNEKCSGIEVLIAKKQQYLTEIENYKKSLIYEYVTGKKEVV